MVSAATAPGPTPLAQEAAHWEPFLPGWIILLPLIGFALNSFLALSAARHSSAAVRAGGANGIPSRVAPGPSPTAFPPGSAPG